MTLNLPWVFSRNEFLKCVVSYIHKLLDCLVILLSSLDNLILDVWLQVTNKFDILQHFMIMIEIFLWSLDILEHTRKIIHCQKLINGYLLLNLWSQLQILVKLELLEHFLILLRKLVCILRRTLNWSAVGGSRPWRIQHIAVWVRLWKTNVLRKVCNCIWLLSHWRKQEITLWFLCFQISWIDIESSYS